MSTRRNCEGRLCEQLCGDLWESGAAGEGCGCYQLGGLNAHLHCYWHINYRCQGDSEGKDFWGSDVAHAPGYGLASAQICPLGTQEARTGTGVKVPNPSSHDAGTATLIAKAAMAREVPEWVLRSRGDLWQGRVDFLGWQEPCLAACMHHFCLGSFIPLWIWKYCWRREGILFLGNGIGFWVQPAAEEKTGYPRTGRSKEGKREFCCLAYGAGIAKQDSGRPGGHPRCCCSVFDCAGLSFSGWGGRMVAFDLPGPSAELEVWLVGGQGERERRQKSERQRCISLSSGSWQTVLVSSKSNMSLFCTEAPFGIHTRLAPFGNSTLDSGGLSYLPWVLLALVFMDQKHILLRSLASSVRMSKSFKKAHWV